MNQSSKQWKNLAYAHKNKALAQGYIFSGPKGTGKFEMLVDFICLLNDFKNKDVVRNGHHPDVMIVEPQIEKQESKKREKDISIVQIKNILKKASYFSYQSRFQFVVIRQADKLSNVAANSLLKFIEEPMSDTIICLTCNNEELVLPTIKSRCQIVRFGLQSDQEIQDALAMQFPELEKSEREKCAKLSHGRIKFAKHLCENLHEIESLEMAQENFRKALKGGLLNGLGLAQDLSADRTKLVQTMEGWVWFLRDFLKKNASSMEKEEISNKVLEIIKTLIVVKHQVEKENVNARIQLDNFFVQMS